MPRPRRILAAALPPAVLVVVATVFAPAAHAGDGDGDEQRLRGSGFTLYVGTRFGGDFEDEASGEAVKLRDDDSFAATLDFPIDGQREIQLQYGKQATELRSAALAPAVGDLPLDLEYLHLGGTYFGETLGRGWYAIGGLGVTRVTPSFEGYDSETKLSGHVGFGYLVPFGSHVGLRLEARGYAVLLGGSSSLFCSGGCALNLGGSGFAQGEILAGISARF